MNQKDPGNQSEKSPEISRLKDILAFVTGVAAVLAAFDQIAGMTITENALPFLSENRILLSVIITALILFTFWLQWPRIMAHVVAPLDDLSQKFSGAVALVNTLVMFLMIVGLLILGWIINEYKDRTEEYTNDYNNRADEHRKNVSRVEDIVKANSTKYLDRFPDDTFRIADLFARVESGDTLQIIIDFPSYGSLSASEKYLKMAQALKNMATRDRVTLLFCYYDNVVAKEKVKKQTLKYWWRNNPEKWEIWKEKFYPNDDIDTDQEFWDALLEVDQKLLESLKYNVGAPSWSTISEEPPLFIWQLKDKNLQSKEAIFSMPQGNYTFSTRSHRLLEELDKIYNERCKGGNGGDA